MGNARSETLGALEIFEKLAAVEKAKRKQGPSAGISQ